LLFTPGALIDLDGNGRNKENARVCKEASVVIIVLFQKGIRSQTELLLRRCA